MNDDLRVAIINTLAKFDVGIMRLSRQHQLEERERSARALALLMELPEHHVVPLMKMVTKSQAQLFQDLFALSSNGLKRNGYFVEFGATDGVTLSNTCLLEREFGWQGILAEPATRWHQKLSCNRHCHIETNCVWAKSDEVLTFAETDIGEFSTIDSFSESYAKKHAHRYQVQTISLQDLLDKYHAPKEIDYMSVDTEGSEYEILSAFDFTRYTFNAITVEHNHGPRRDKVHELLTQHGYTRKFDHLATIEDWYVRDEPA
ncbi:MAG TPA: FkbM family methyltransferase [Terracidiphilus sp.]|nr:FkbM family methyltransferase [Terracidiphilus sp.]